MNQLLATERSRREPKARDRAPRGFAALPRHPIAPGARGRAAPAADSPASRESMASLGWDARLGAAYQPYDRPDHRPARVSRVERGVCTLLGADTVRRASVAGQVLVSAARDVARLPCPGDWVVVRAWPDARWTVEAVLPRHGTVWRDPERVPVAGNVDIVMTVDDFRSCAPRCVDRLRALLAPGRTLALIGADARSRSAVLAALAGTAVLSPGGALVPLPGGGAVIDVDGDRLVVDEPSFGVQSATGPARMPDRPAAG